MKYDIRQAAQALVSQLKAIDYERLPISKYNKRYIARLKPVLSYYMKIYADCILKGLESIGSSPEEITLIDYGGGSGFLSILAKQAGIGRVIYIDLNPDSVDTIRILKELVNTGPDIILHGDSDTLADWCSANKVKPHRDRPDRTRLRPVGFFRQFGCHRQQDANVVYNGLHTF